MTIIKNIIVYSLSAISAATLFSCNDSTTNESTTYTTDTSGTNSLFDGRSGKVGDSAWKIPESGFSDHQEDRVATWTLDAAVKASAQLGASKPDNWETVPKRNVGSVLPPTTDLPSRMV